MEKLYEAATQFRNLIYEHKKVVLLVGAGMSTTSGIKAFRGENGELSKPPLLGFSREEINHVDFLHNYPDLFFQEFRPRLKSIYNAKPSYAYQKLALLYHNKRSNIIGVLTTNVDGLLQASGIPEKEIIELHGTAHSGHCEKCGKTGFSLEYMIQGHKAPRCDREDCTGLVRPDIVLPGEQVDLDKFTEAVWITRHADLFLIIGSCLHMYPTAGIIDYYRGHDIGVLNGDNLWRTDIKPTWSCRYPINDLILAMML